MGLHFLTPHGTPLPHTHGTPLPRTPWDPTSSHPMGPHFLTPMGPHFLAPHGTPLSHTPWDPTSSHPMGPHFLAPHGTPLPHTPWDPTFSHPMGPHSSVSAHASLAPVAVCHPPAHTPRCPTSHARCGGCLLWQVPLVEVRRRVAPATAAAAAAAATRRRPRSPHRNGTHDEPPAPKSTHGDFYVRDHHVAVPPPPRCEYRVTLIPSHPTPSYRCATATWSTASRTALRSSTASRVAPYRAPPTRRSLSRCRHCARCSTASAPLTPPPRRRAATRDPDPASGHACIRLWLNSLR
jgi:hypothetical protein